MSEDIENFMLKSDQIQRIYIQKESVNYNENTIQMFELFHYLNMCFNKNINFNNIDDIRLGKLLSNILMKFEDSSILRYFENINVNVIMAIIEHSFYSKNIQQIMQFNPILNSKVYIWVNLSSRI